MSIDLSIYLSVCRVVYLFLCKCLCLHRCLFLCLPVWLFYLSIFLSICMCADLSIYLSFDCSFLSYTYLSICLSSISLLVYLSVDFLTIYLPDSTRSSKHIGFARWTARYNAEWSIDRSINLELSGDNLLHTTLIHSVLWWQSHTTHPCNHAFIHLIHWGFRNSLSVCLSASLFICRSIYLWVCLSTYLCLCLCLRLDLYQCLCLSVSISIYPPIYLSICLST